MGVTAALKSVTFWPSISRPPCSITRRASLLLVGQAGLHEERADLARLRAGDLGLGPIGVAQLAFALVQFLEVALAFQRRRHRRGRGA